MIAARVISIPSSSTRTEDPHLTGRRDERGRVCVPPGPHRHSEGGETIVLERDIRLAMTRGRYHAASITCAESIEVLRRAKNDGHTVTAAASVNHLMTLNEAGCRLVSTFFKLAPPLRAEPDRVALVEALKEGLIDVVMSDHNPQDVEVKRLPFAEAGFRGDRAGEHTGWRVAPWSATNSALRRSSRRCRPDRRNCSGCPADRYGPGLRPM